MQILRAGTVVHARRHRWRVVDARAYDDCQLITLSGLGPANAGVEARLLVPFDSVEPVPVSRTLRIVRPARWRRACRTLLSGGFSEDTLCAAGRARIELLPHQLEPAIAVIRGDGCRLLLADEVGLGKTIQAGVTIAELRARGAADRVLVLTPAGLREQWAEELSHRFDIAAEIVDFRSVAKRVSALPFGINPWTTWPIAIASIDYAKRPEVLPAVLSCSWDVVVVDEAHGLANDNDRHEAVAAIAARAAYVVLLTATPHNGDAHAFRSLCAIGGQSDRLLVFRRSRSTIKSGNGRRVHRLLVRPSAAERRMHVLLTAFSRAVRAERGRASRDVWLALAVLHKRAYSSARALHQSVTRRLATMTPEGGAQQLRLPIDFRGEADAADEAPAWQAAIALRDSALERRLLTSLAEAAQTAASSETKLSALVRLLNRIGEPVIVFTEYRDTLAHVALAIRRQVVVLHGGLSRHERAAALETFAAGGRAILLATDAAGEGLNLQRKCRTVINLELPWNPMRLEQRIGRVDRIGQHRTVHAFHLIAAGTGEQRLLADLREKIARAGTDIGAPNPLGDARNVDAEYRAARIVVGDDGDRLQGAWPVESESQAPGPVAQVPGAMSLYQAEAVAEALRLDAERALARIGGSTRAQQADDAPLATAVRNTATRMRLGARVLLIWEVAVEDGCGRGVCSRPVAITISLERLPRARADALWVERVLVAATADALAAIESVSAPVRDSAIAAVRSFVAARIAREHRVGASLAAEAVQPGLFDRRVHHAQATAQTLQHQLAEARARRLVVFERRAALAVLPPALRLVLIP